MFPHAYYERRKITCVNLTLTDFQIHFIEAGKDQKKKF